MFNFYKSALSGDITSPLCADYKSEWRSCGDNKEKLIKLALRQQSIPYFITHCENGCGLSMDYIINEYGDFINGKSVIHDADGVEGYTYGLYVDFKGILTASNDVSCMMWCNTPQINIEPTRAVILYIGCNSDVRIVLGGYNTLKIYVFDNSRVEVSNAHEDSSGIVYRYGNAKAIRGKYCLCDIKVFDKELRL